jgi:hypothetical protein
VENKMDFYKLNSKFQKKINKEGLDYLLTEVEDATQYSVEFNMKFDNTVAGSLEDKVIRIRSIEGVTIVDTKEEDQFGNVRVRLKFHPRLESMRPVTYIRTVLLPQINSATYGQGVTITKIIPGTLKDITR